MLILPVDVDAGTDDRTERLARTAAEADGLIQTFMTVLDCYV